MERAEAARLQPHHVEAFFVARVRRPRRHLATARAAPVRDPLRAARRSRNRTAIAGTRHAVVDKYSPRHLRPDLRADRGPRCRRHAASPRSPADGAPRSPSSATDTTKPSTRDRSSSTARPEHSTPTSCAFSNTTSPTDVPVATDSHGSSPAAPSTSASTPTARSRRSRRPPSPTSTLPTDAEQAAAEAIAREAMVPSGRSRRAECVALRGRDASPRQHPRGHRMRTVARVEKTRATRTTSASTARSTTGTASRRDLRERNAQASQPRLPADQSSNNAPKTSSARLDRR